MRKAFLVILVSTIFIISCDDEGMNEDVNPFVGTWANEFSRYVFTDNYVISFTSENIKWWSGTYTYDEKDIFITADYRHPDMNDFREPLIFPYSINDNTMIFAVVTLTKMAN